MKCLIHGDDEKECELYTGIKCCISENDNLDSGDFINDKLYEAIDRLYESGWTDRRKGKDYDPRGAREWQFLLDIFRIKKEYNLKRNP